MMRNFFFICGFTVLLALGIINVMAQDRILLYGGAIPAAKQTPAELKEEISYTKDSVKRLSKVSDPALYVYQPAKANGTAVIICPGGGYGFLAIDKEGHSVAKKFQENGITAFVLKYRLPNDLIMKDKSTGPLQDALQAIYLIRKNAKAFNINPNKVGIMGFSAGGHLAATASTHFADMKIDNNENINLRPSFSLLIYPVITFGNFTHAGSVNKLLGDKPTDVQLSYFSAEKNVSPNTPPTFLVHANNDMVVPVLNSLRYNEALVKNGVPTEMHIYQAGGHGFGLYNKTSNTDWFALMLNWMKGNKF